jgi:branched-chain amino acid transport system permease protein
MEILVFGLTLSLMYGLIAAGFALILGASRIFDLCFGSYYLLAAYSYYVLYGLVGKLPALFLSIVIAAGLAWIIHRVILFRFREVPIVVMVVSAALAIGISEAITLIFGSDYKYVPPLLEGSIDILGASIANQRLLAGIVAIAALTLLWLYLNKTKYGLGIRALIQQPEVAELAGVRPRNIHLTVACVGAVLGALGSIMVVPVFTLTPHIWLDAILLAFAGVVVGGLGSVWGAFLAMVLIAFSETLVSFLIPEGGFFRQAVYVFIMVVVLLVRPYGIFGKKEEA